MTITAIMIDRREPDWIKNLSFNDIPTAVTELEAGDIWASTDDGHTIVIERKSPDDFLGSLRDERLLPQLARLSEKRHIQQEKGEFPTWWPYLVIDDSFLRNGNKVSTPERGDTGWSWGALQGALLTIQEMGVMVVFSGGGNDFADCILRLGNRCRERVLNLLPARMPLMLGAQYGFIASLPGIGAERVISIMNWAGNRPIDALMGLTDLSIPCPIDGFGLIARKRIRTFLGLRDEEDIAYINQEALGEKVVLLSKEKSL